MICSISPFILSALPFGIHGPTFVLRNNIFFPVLRILFLPNAGPSPFSNAHELDLLLPCLARFEIPPPQSRHLSPPMKREAFSSLCGRSKKRLEIPSPTSAITKPSSSGRPIRLFSDDFGLFRLETLPCSGLKMILFPRSPNSPAAIPSIKDARASHFFQCPDRARYILFFFSISHVLFPFFASSFSPIVASFQQLN